jgi:hypothetical protein
MLHFLRRIRRSLIGTGATRKYLLYAIGEILLVMIGILLALQVNNWNEHRITRNTEIELLEEINEEFEANKITLKRNINEAKIIVNSRQVIIDVIENELPYHDSLKFHFNNFPYQASYPIANTAFAALENWGIMNLSNDTIRDQIVYFYKIKISELESHFQVAYDVVTGQYLDLNLSLINWGDLSNLEPYDYTQFIKHKEFMKKEKFVKATQEVLLNEVESTITLQIDRIIQNLIEEVKRLSK